MNGMDDAPAGNPLAAIWRQRIVFAAVFCGVLGFVVILLLVLPSRFIATGSVIVAEPETGLSLPPAGWAQKVGDPADLESQLLVVRSPRILRLVMQAPGVVDFAQAECRQSLRIPLLTTGSCDDLTAGAPELLDYLQSHYSFGGAGRSRVISISYTSASPDTAQNMANALITTFLEDHRRSLAGSRAVAAQGIAEEMARLDADIRKTDGAVRAYRSTKGLTSGATAPLTAERLSGIGQQLSNAEALRDSAAAILLTAKAGGNVAALPAVLESRAVADIKQRLASVNEQANAAAIVLGPRHPRLRVLQEQVRSLQHRLDVEIGNVVISAQKQLDAATATAASLRAQMETAKTDVSVATTDEGAIEQLVRDAGIKRQQYAELYEKRKTLESEERAVLGSTRLVNLAEKPLKRFFPKTLPFAAGGTMLGLMAATGIALLRDRRVVLPPPAQTPEPTPPAEIPLLARLPIAAGETDFAFALAAVEQNAQAISALQSLHAAILAIEAPGRQRSVLMLSAFPGEGKTFAVMALARFAAREGSRVLVVECNMRAPFLQAALGLRAPADLQGVLSRQARPRFALARSGVSRLDIIFAGKALTDPTDLLLGQGFKDLLEWAKSYDLVLFDSPALNAAMDAGLLARQMDGVVIGARDAKNNEAVAMVSRSLANLGARTIGVVHMEHQPASFLEGHIQAASRGAR